MQMNPYISVIVPMFNSADDIRNNIKSLEAQAYKNFEVIFVDDFSKDNTLDILEALLNKSKLNYKILSNSKNQGVSYSRNKGIKHSKGEYIYFLDSDDFIEENTFQLFIEFIKSEGAELVFGKFDRVNDKGEAFHTYDQVFKGYTGTLKGNDVIKKLLYNEIWLAMGATIFKKAIINEFNIFFTVGCHNGEDQEFIMKFLYRSTRVSCCNQVIFHYYQRLNSITNSSSLRRITVATAFGNLYYYLEGYNVSQELLNIIKMRKLPIEVIKNVDKLPKEWIYMELPNGLTIEHLKTLVRPFKMSNYGISELKLIFKIKLFLFSPQLFCKVMNRK